MILHNLVFIFDGAVQKVYFRRMKKNSLAFLLVFLFFAQFIHAADSTQAKILFFRPDYRVGSASTARIHVTDSIPVHLLNNSYFEYTGSAGTYNLYDAGSKKKPLKVEVQQGKTYYVMVMMVQEVFSSYFQLVQTDSASAMMVLGNKKAKDMRKPIIRPLNRIGLLMDMGGGLNDVTIGQTDDGKDIDISFGGGLGFALSYGMELSKHFDLSADLGWYQSALNPRISNGDMTFSRYRIGFTGSYIIPLAGGYAQRLKIGAGGHYDLGNELKISMSKVPGGFNDTWKYEDATGFHASFLYEVNASDHISWDMGLKYNYITYKFKSGGTYFPTDSRLGSPDGQAIYFFVGMNVHF